MKFSRFVHSIYLVTLLFMASSTLQAQQTNSIPNTTQQNSQAGPRAVYDHILVVLASGNGFNDLTRIAFGTLFTDTFDSNYDALKLMSNVGQPNIYTMMNSTKLAINAVPNYQTQRDIYMPFEPGNNGTFVLHFDSLHTFNRTALIFCEDRKLNTIKNLMRDSVYTFTSNVADSTRRFILHFLPPASAITTPTLCTASTGSVQVNLGAYNVNGTNIIWDSYVLKNAANQTIDSISQASGTLTTNNLPVGNYTIILTMNGYVATIAATVQSSGSGITPAFTPDSSTLHIGSAVSFINSSINGATYAWSFGDGGTSNLQTPAPYTYANTGSYVVTLIVSNGTCFDTARHTVKVIDLPIVVSTTSAAACGGFGTILTDLDQFDVDTPAAVWDLYLVRNSLGATIDSQTNISANVTTTGLQPGIYTVSLTRGGNTLLLVDTVLQTGSVTAEFTTDSSLYHVNGTVLFTSTSLGAAVYAWDFGDGSTSTQPNPSHSYSNFGTYAATLIISNGSCTDTISHDVTVKDNPILAATSTSADCINNGSITTDLDLLDTDSPPAIWNSYILKNAAGATIDSQTNVTNAVTTGNLPAGIYTIAVTKNGNTVVITDTVLLINNLVASFTADSTSVHVGSVVTFTSTSSGAVNYSWDFADGTTAGIPSPTHVYGTAGIYKVTLLITDHNCSSSSSQDISVLPIHPGIDELTNENIRISATGNIIMIFNNSGFTGNAQIAVYDVLGRTVYTNQNISLDNKRIDINLPENLIGYYFVRITAISQNLMGRVLLKKD